MFKNIQSKFSLKDDRQTPNCIKRISIPWSIALITILAATGGLIAFYMLQPACHQIFNRFFMQNLTLTTSALVVSVPIVLVSCILILTIYIYKKHKRRKERDLFDICSPLTEFKNTLKSLLPTQKQLIIISIVFAAITATLLGGYFAIQHFAPNILQQKIQLWAAISYFGGATAGIIMLIALSYLCHKKWQERIQKIKSHPIISIL